MEYGIVKSWDAAKGFGFITTDNDEDLFVHVNGLDVSVKAKRLVAGQRVAFDIRSDYKGDSAFHVRIVK